MKVMTRIQMLITVSSIVTFISNLFNFIVKYEEKFYNEGKINISQ